MSMNFMPVNVFATNFFFESLQCHWFTYWGMDKTGLAFCMHTMHVIVHRVFRGDGGGAVELLKLTLVEDRLTCYSNYISKAGVTEQNIDVHDRSQCTIG